jgi:hypothetical protein
MVGHGELKISEAWACKTMRTCLHFEISQGIDIQLDNSK